VVGLSVEEKAIRELLRYPNVVGVSRKTKKRIRKGKVVDEEVIRVYVEKKLPLDQLKPDEAIPREIEAEIEGKRRKIGTDVVEIGRIKAYLDPKKKYRPIPAGVSTSRLEGGGTGTVGWFVFNEDGELFMISNHHVWVYPLNQGVPGDKLIQPGNVDGGDEDDVFGELYGFIEINFGEGYTNYVDLALAKPYDYSQIYLAILGLGGLAGYRDPVLNESATKIGRSTGQTTGIVTDDSAIAKVYYDENQYAWFDDVFIVEGSGVVEAGDSGSPVYSLDNKFFGLLFAGSGNDLYVGCKASRILEALQNKYNKKFFPVYGNAPIPFYERRKFKWCIHLVWKLWVCRSY